MPLTATEPFTTNSRLVHFSLASMRRRILAILCSIGLLALLVQIVCGQRPELITQTGHHPTTIFQIAFSPDGKTLATACWDKSVRLWDVKTGVEIRTFWNVELFTAVAFDRKGGVLAGGSSEEVIVWDVKTGSILRDFKTDGITIDAFAFDESSKVLAAASQDKPNHIELWNIETGVKLNKFPGPAEYVKKLAFSPDGGQLASVDNKSVKVWDVVSGSLVQTLPNMLPNAIISEDLRLIAGVKDNLIKVFDASDGKEPLTIEVPRPGDLSNFITAIAFSPDGRILASGESLGTVRLWDSSTARELHTLTGSSFYFNRLAIAPTGDVIAMGDLQGRVKLWDAKRSRALTTFYVSSGILGLEISPDGETIATSTIGNTLKLWNFQKRTLVRISPLSKQYLQGEASDPTGNRTALSQKRAFGISSFSFSSDGNLIAIGGRDQNITLWSLAPRTYLRTIFFKAEPTSIALTTNKRMLVAAGENVIKIFRVLDGKLLLTVPRNCPRNRDCLK